MKTLVSLLTMIGLFTLLSCRQDAHTNTMMHQNGDYHYWGMHMGWWVFLLIIIIVLIVFFNNFIKRK
jgi:uncharacterized membrane protein